MDDTTTNDNSKNEILNTAIRLFSQKGYEGVGVQEICDNAGITKPTLYYFFKSKQGLLQAIADSKGAELLQRLSDAAVYEHDFLKSLTRILTAAIDFALAHPDFFNLHSVLLNAPGNAETEAVYAPLKKRFDSVLADFFIKSANEFGNMRGKEELYSILFHNNVISVALSTVSLNLLKIYDASTASYAENKCSTYQRYACALFSASSLYLHRLFSKGLRKSISERTGMSVV